MIRMIPYSENDKIDKSNTQKRKNQDDVLCVCGSTLS